MSLSEPCPKLSRQPSYEFNTTLNYLTLSGSGAEP